MPKSAHKPTSIRIRQNLYKQLVEVSNREDKSLNKLINSAIEQSLKTWNLERENKSIMVRIE